jgi:iron complex transport system substrate-binding protein
MRCWMPLLALLAGCSGQAPIVRGKIVSNNPCVDAILAEVAMPEQIGAVSSFSHNAASASAPLGWARTFPAVGTEAEAIISAQPRLALVGAFGRSDALDRAGVRYRRFNVPVSVAESLEQIRSLSESIDRKEQGEQLANAVALSATPIHQTAKSRRAIIWLSGGFVPGKGTLQDELLARAGFINASESYGLKQWDVLPLETLVRNPPDIIFTPDGGEGDDRRARVLRHRVLAEMAGQTRIVAFPEKLLNCGGPNIIAMMKVLRS